MRDSGEQAGDDALQREVLALRAQVAELQRAATGYSEEATRSELGHPVLAKPFTAAALWNAISDVVGANPQ